MNTLWLCLAALAAFLGFALLAISQKQHRRTIEGGKSLAHARTKCLVVGWAMNLMSLSFCIVRDGISFAALLWPLISAAAALLVAAGLACRPSIFHPIMRFLAKSNKEP